MIDLIQLFILEYAEGIVAVVALILTVVTLRRDRKERQMSNLNTAYQQLQDINLEAITLNEDERTDEELEEDAKIVNKEKLNQYEYLAFMINRRKVSEKTGYELGYKDFMDIYDRYEDLLNEEDFPEINELVCRWKNYEPKNRRNRTVSWMLRFYKH